jgi:hypothetical protein
LHPNAFKRFKKARILSIEINALGSDISKHNKLGFIALPPTNFQV